MADEEPKKELTDEEAYQIAMQIAVRGMSEGGRKIHRRHQLFALYFILGVLVLGIAIVGIMTLIESNR